MWIGARQRPRLQIPPQVNIIALNQRVARPVDARRVYDPPIGPKTPFRALNRLEKALQGVSHRRIVSRFDTPSGGPAMTMPDVDALIAPSKTSDEQPDRAAKFVTLSTLCRQYNVEGGRARMMLRKAGVKKMPGAPWEWRSNDPDLSRIRSILRGE